MTEAIIGGQSQHGVSCPVIIAHDNRCVRAGDKDAPQVFYDNPRIKSERVLAFDKGLHPGR
ncbi:MAG: hypothetical protein WEA08_06065 [Woeseia sp.]